MNRYTLHCTEEQTKKASRLGAPIETVGKKDNRLSIQNGFVFALIPTVEQMIGWLEEQGVYELSVNKSIYNYSWTILFKDDNRINGHEFNSRKEATLAAIDAALEYLIKNKI